MLAVIVVPVTAAGVLPPTIPSIAPTNLVFAVIVVPVIAAGVLAPMIPSMFVASMLPLFKSA